MAAHASGVFLDVETQAAASQDAGQRRLRMAWFFQGMGLAALMLIGVAAMGGLPSGSEKPSGHDAAVAGWLGGALPTTRTGGKAAMSQAKSTWSSRSSRHGLRFASPVVMVQDEVEDKVKGIIAEELGVEAGSVKPDSSFTEDLGADSLDAVELVMALEEAFDIEIPDEEAETMTTPADCVAAIKSKM